MFLNRGRDSGRWEHEPLVNSRSGRTRAEGNEVKDVELIRGMLKRLDKET